jgi:hypothetical protein
MRLDAKNHSKVTRSAGEALNNCLAEAAAGRPETLGQRVQGKDCQGCARPDAPSYTKTENALRISSPPGAERSRGQMVKQIRRSETQSESLTPAGAVLMKAVADRS